MEENWSKVQEIDGYTKYIATRPRAERLGEHGLFGDEDAVDLNAAMAEVNSYTGNIWTHIISLRREDAGGWVRSCGRMAGLLRRTGRHWGGDAFRRRTFVGMRRSTTRAVTRTFT